MIMNGGICGGEAISVRPFPSHGGSAVDGETAACQAPSRCLVLAIWPMLLPTLLPSSINHTVARHQPSHCHHLCCFPPPSTPLLSAIDTHIVIAHVIVIHVVVRHRHRRRRRRRCHNCRFYCYSCHFLADCCLLTLHGALPAVLPPSFVMPFDDVVLPPWALALDDTNSCRADARHSSGRSRPPPLASNPACGNGLFSLLLSLSLSPALAAAVAE
jgi:hypothetical protein